MYYLYAVGQVECWLASGAPLKLVDIVLRFKPKIVLPGIRNQEVTASNPAAAR